MNETTRVNLKKMHSYYYRHMVIWKISKGIHSC